MKREKNYQQEADATKGAILDKAVLKAETKIAVILQYLENVISSN